MNNNSKLFPNGPEEYIKKGQKKMVITIVVIVLCMIAVLLWSCFGYINVSKKTIAIAEEGTLYVVVQTDFVNSVGIGTKFNIDGVEYVADFEPNEVYHPFKTQYDDDFERLPWFPKLSKDEYLSNFGIRKSPLPEGWYVATILMEKCHPIKLLFE